MVVDWWWSTGAGRCGGGACNCRGVLEGRRKRRLCLRGGERKGYRRIVVVRLVLDMVNGVERLIDHVLCINVEDDVFILMLQQNCFVFLNISFSFLF